MAWLQEFPTENGEVGIGMVKSSDTIED